MKAMKHSLLFLLATLSCGIFAQREQNYKNQFELTTFRFNQNSQTIHERLEPKFVTGLNYERRKAQWSWTNGIEYG